MFEDNEEFRVFTLIEARSLIPTLRRLLTRMRKSRGRLLDLRVEIDLARENARYGGGSAVGPLYLKYMLEFTEAIQEIQALGVQVKDLGKGLVDFPYEYEGRIVFLCWKPDEDEINWWHETDAGFAGRQPLTDEFE
ncbi:MAG TPA: DUF2203 domain-containing protein [Blastocatellia bacterium]|nr:DUF2203 domain-containing protein [Blastocatellia bacterium]